MSRRFIRDPPPHAHLIAASLLACAPPLDGGGGQAVELGPPPLVGYPVVTAPCGDPPAPARFLVATTTDFSTGAISVVDLADGRVHADVALGSTDAKPFAHGGLVYVLHRYLIDALDVLDPDAAWQIVDQQAIDAPDAASANPQAIAFADGRAYVTLHASAELAVFDLADPRHPIRDEGISLARLSDADGSPEPGLAVACGDVLFVALQRLDRAEGFRPRHDHDAVVAVDRRTGQLHDLDPGAPGVQPIELLGRWARQWRRDPDDPSGRAMLVLTTGLERLDLATGASQWVVAPALLEAVGVASYLQPQAFALDRDGVAYIASYTADFREVQVHRVGWGGRGPAAPELVLEGLQISEQAIEIIDDTLWVADRTIGASGLRAYDLLQHPARPLPGPLATGLAPYAILAAP